jgi:serine/threonine-protein kinase
MLVSAPRVLSGKYRLETLLGKGGMGEVWQAVHVELDTAVAVKILAEDVAASESAAGLRLRHEARATARLRSPHVVQILDFGVDLGSPYIVMELLEGETLKERLEKTPRLGISFALRVVEQAAAALALAHSDGIVHRDIKPSNLFLTRGGDDEIVKVLDFGIAKVGGPGEPGVTLPGTVVGSPGFMSPEQADGQRVDGRSDLWSLAAVAFHMLTGEPAFRGQTLTELRTSMRAGPRKATEICSDLPPELDAFFPRALAVAPGERFQSARELVHAFRVATGMTTGAAAYSGEPTDVGRETTTCEMTVTPAEIRRAPEVRKPWGRVLGPLVLGVSLTAIGVIVGRAGNQPRPTVPSSSSTVRELPLPVPASPASAEVDSVPHVVEQKEKEAAPQRVPRAKPLRTIKTSAVNQTPPTPVPPSATSDPLFGLAPSHSTPAAGAPNAHE